MVREAYVSFEVAKLLKEKGFNIPCRSFYWCIQFSDAQPAVADYNRNFNGGPQDRVSRPTHQMALALLREAHNIDIDIHSDCGMLGIKQYTPYIHTYTRMEPLHDEDTKVRWKQKSIFPQICRDKGLISAHMSFDSYEEAVKAALKYSLKNII